MNDLLTFFDSLGKPKILVIGDIILDRYTWGDAERVSPEAPVLVLKADVHEARLGGAASVANLLRALDAHVALAGVIGDDGNGRIARHLLDDAGIDSSLVHCDPARPTTSKHRLLGRAEGKHPHHLLRVDEECSRLLTEDVQQQLSAQILDRLAEFDAVLISDYAKGVCRTDQTTTTWHYDGSSPESGYTVETEPTETILLQAIIRAANEHGIPVLVDSARLPECDCYHGATLLKPNRFEAELTSGFKIDTPAAAMRVGKALCQKLDLQAVVVTLDHDGMVLSQREAPSELFPAAPRAVCDITGTGDMALATLGLALASTKSDSAPSPRPCGERAGVRGFASSPSIANATSTNPDEDSTSSHPPCGVREFDSTVFTAAIKNAVRLANIASGLQVERFGVTAVRRDEIRTEILKTSDADQSNINNLAKADELKPIAQVNE